MTAPDDASRGGYLPETPASTGPCSEGPDRCIDDMCRGNDVGMCGALSEHLLGITGTEDDEDALAAHPDAGSDWAPW